MASSSLDDDKFALYGFSDLQSFKEFVVYVFSCAPDMFPPEDWRAPDDQMNLNRAFDGLRYGLDMTAKEKGKSDVVAKCRVLVDEAYTAYTSGQNMEGQRKLEAVEKLLKRLRSQSVPPRRRIN